MKLPSGADIHKDLVETIVEAIVLEYASFGFEDFDVAVKTAQGSVEEGDWVCRGMPEDPVKEDVSYLFSVVEPIAKELGNELAKEYLKLQEKFMKRIPD